MNTPENTPRKMLTEQQLQDSSRRRARIMVPTMVMMTFVGLVYGLGVAFQSTSLSPRLAILLLLGIIPLIVIPCLIADHFAKRHTLFCPNCSEGLIYGLGMLRDTRCCPFCRDHILEGQPRSLQAYQRYLKWDKKRSDHRTAKYLVWVFPLLSTLDLSALTTSDDTLPHHMKVIFGLFPVIALGFTLFDWHIRKDRYFAIPAAVSLILLILTALHFWYAR